MTPFQEIAALNYARVTADNLQSSLRQQNQELALIRSTIEKSNAAARAQAEEFEDEETDRITARALLCDLESLLKGLQSGTTSPTSLWRNVALATTLLFYTKALGNFESIDDLRFQKSLEDSVNALVPVVEAEMGVNPYLLDGCSEIDAALQQAYAIWCTGQIFLISPEKIDKLHEDLWEFDHPLTRAPFIPDFDPKNINYNEVADSLLTVTDLKIAMDNELDEIRQGFSALFLNDDGTEIASEVYMSSDITNLQFQAMARKSFMGIKPVSGSVSIGKNWKFLGSRDLREFVFKTGQMYANTVEALDWVMAELRALDAIFRQDNALLEEVNSLTAEGNYRSAREKLASCSGWFSNYKIKDFEDAVNASASLISESQVLLGKVDALAKRKKSLIGHMLGSGDQVTEINSQLGRLQAALASLPECEIADDLRKTLERATTGLSKDVGLKLAETGDD